MSSSLNGATLPVYTTVPAMAPRSTGVMATGNGVLPEVIRMLMSMTGRPGQRFAYSAHAPAATRSPSITSFRSVEPARLRTIRRRQPSPLISPGPTPVTSTSSVLPSFIEPSR